MKRTRATPDVIRRGGLAMACSWRIANMLHDDIVDWPVVLLIRFVTYFLEASGALLGQDRLESSSASLAWPLFVFRF